MLMLNHDVEGSHSRFAIKLSVVGLAGVHTLDVL